MNNPEENLKPDSAAHNVEMQRRFNELRGELLDKRAVSIDRWLSVIAIVLTFFGVVVAVAGYIGFTRFQEIETEAKGYVEEIKKNRDISVGYLDSIKTVTAEIVANNPEKAKQVATKVGENPGASLIDKAIAQAVLLQEQGKKDEAIEKWRAVAHITEGIDDDLAAKAWFSVGYLFGEENPEACVLANNEVIRLKPDFAGAYRNRGAAKGALGHYEDAIADSDKAISLKPYDVQAYNNRGYAKALLGRYADAFADFDEAISLKPDYAEAYYNRGVLKGALERYADAIADYDEAISLKSDYAEAYNNRGNAKGRLDQHEDAIVDFDEAIRLKPDFAEAYNNRGIDKAALDLIDEARQDFEKARDLAQAAGKKNLADDAEQRLRALDSDEDE